MLTCILLFMVGLKLAMGTVYFVVLAIAAILCCIKFDIFQPTPSSRRVTTMREAPSGRIPNFNQHPPHGG